MTLTPRHKQIAMKFCFGYTPKEISEEFNISLGTLARWQQDPNFSTQITEYQNRVLDSAARENVEEAKNGINGGLPSAAKLLIDTIDDAGIDLKTRLGCAFDVLNRGGITAPQKHIHAVGDIGQLIEAAYRKNHPEKVAEDIIDIENHPTDSKNPKVNSDEADTDALPISVSAGV